MELLKQLISLKIEKFEIEKARNKWSIYDFFQALSLALAYFKFFEDREVLTNEEKDYISQVWQDYIINSLKEAIGKNKRKELETIEDWQKRVKMEYYSISQIYFEELLKFIDKHTPIIEEFKSRFYKTEDEKKKEKEMSYSDIKLKYSMGIKKW